ncbi:MAG: hypothetical protein IT289_00485 [Oligoflexia bacterium]|nr:hypothetical protein [Oligoflexia bacterium]
MDQKIRFLKFGLLIACSVGLTACAALRTHPGNASYYEEDYAAYAAQKSGALDAMDELGYAPSKPLSADEAYAIQTRVRLKNLESQLSSSREREQYYKYKPYLDNDEERVQFLKLQSFEAKERYALQKGIATREVKYSSNIMDAVAKGDIVLGMTKDAVVESWGDPSVVEVAGSQLYGNERWTYVDYISTPEGFQKEERILYFESGKVVGWRKN